MEVVQGGNAVLRAEFLDSSGDPLSVSISSLRIFNPDADLILDVPLTDIVQEAPNRYRYIYMVPQDAETGVWSAIWLALTDDEKVVGGNEDFRIVEVNPDSLISVPQLRMLINDRIPAGGTDSDTEFTDNELALILERMNGSLYAAAAEGWYVKAGSYELFINVDESGSNRNLEDVFKHALMMGDRYKKAWSEELEGLAGMYEGRIPGRSISPWKRDVDPNVIPPFSGYEVTYERYFPLMRFTYSVMG